MKFTELEYRVLCRCAQEKNPWAPWSGNTGPGGRSVSQAIQRLKRKGALIAAEPGASSWPLTDAGKAYLVEFCSHPGVAFDPESGWWLCNVCHQRPPQTDVHPAGKISEPKA